MTQTSNVAVNVNAEVTVATSRMKLGTQIGYGQIKAFGTDVHMQGAAKSFNCKLIRFFDREVDGSNPFYSFVAWNEATETGTFNWTDIDKTIKAMFAIGAEPLIVLGDFWQPSVLANPNTSRQGMPPGMAVDPATGIPKPATWAKYCAAWVQHFKDVGLPVRFYEIVNEAWCSGTNNTDRNNYMLVVNAAVAAMKAINPDVSISCDVIGYSVLLDWWLAHGGVALDRIDFHKYDCGTITSISPYHYNDATMFTRAETVNLTVSNYLGRPLLSEQAAWKKARGKTLPLMNSESNFNSAWSGGTDTRQQLIQGAVWLGLELREEILLGLDYHIYFVLAGSYGYEHGPQKPHDGYGFGFINSDDWKPYVPYYVYQYLGNNLTEGDPILETAVADTRLRVLAWTHAGKLHIMLINKTHDHITADLQGLTGYFTVYKVDESISAPTNTNPYAGPPITDTTAASSIALNGYTVCFLTQDAPTPPQPPTPPPPVGHLPGQPAGPALRYIYWSSEFTPQQFVELSDGMEAHFDAVGGVTALTLRSGYKTFLYRNVRDVHDNPADVFNGMLELDYFRQQGWLLKDGAGKEVVDPAYPGNHYCDIGNSGYQAWIAKWLLTQIQEKHYPACFLDNGQSPVSSSWSYGASGTPINPRTTKPFTDVEVQEAYLAMYQAIKQTVGNDVIVVANSIGVGTGYKYFRFPNYRQPTITMLKALNGFMSEQWASTAGHAYFPELPGTGNYDWLDSMQMLIDFEAEFSNMNVILVAMAADDASAGLTSDAEKAQYCAFQFASMLLGIGPKNTYWLNLGNWGAKNMQSLFDINLGTPLENYYKDGNGLYVRSFTHGKVVVNPSDTARAGVLAHGAQISIT